MKNATLLTSLTLLLALSTVAEAKWSRKSRLSSNSHRYHDSGFRPGRGHSGNTTLTARALVNKDSTTTLEVTTGSLDSNENAPGSIEKIKQKILSPSGKVLSTTNYNHLNNDGTFVTVLSGVSPDQSIQIDAEISGSYSRRKDKVSVTTRAVLRPDLSITGVHAAASSLRGAPVTIIADLRELNGHLGSTGECVLSVDGQEVSRIPGVWVDSGSLVNCQFTHTFSEYGNHSYSVAVANSVPADFDSSNNQESGNIQIASPMTMTWDLNASALYNKYRYGSGYVRAYSYDQKEEIVHNTNLTVKTNEAMTYPVKVKVESTSAGAIIYGETVEFGSPDSIQTGLGSQISCASRQDIEAGHYLTFCSLITNTGNSTQLTVTTASGKIVYTCTDESQCGWYESQSEYGNDTLFGDSVHFEAAVSDANALSFSLSKDLNLLPYESNHGWSDDIQTCLNVREFGYCEYTKGVIGSASGNQ